MNDQASRPDDQGRTTVVSLPGEVSYYTAPQVHAELVAALEPGVTTVILDLTMTTFFDSAGLAKLAVGRRLATVLHIDLRVVLPPASPLAGFFASNGFDRLLEIYPTLRDALTAPRASRAAASPALPPPDFPAGSAWVAGGAAWTRSN